jgi:hypothetical protein
MIENYRKLIFDALQLASKKKIDIYTFALYHDHESGVVSVCLDTIESSTESVQNSNEFSNEYFKRSIKENDLKAAAQWCANGGRSFSLGDFKSVNITGINVTPKTSKSKLYIDMVLAINEMSELISRQSKHGKQLMFCSSTATEEVGLVWSI